MAASHAVPLASCPARVEAGGMIWQMRGGPPSAGLRRILEAPEEWLGRRDLVVKSARAVTVVRIPVGDAAGTAYYLKRFGPAGVWDTLRSGFRQSRAEREFRAGCELEDRGVRVAPPVAFAERRRAGLRLTSYLITTEVPHAVTLRESEAQVLRFPQGREILRALADLLAGFYSAHLAHEDLSPSNLLLQRTDGGPQLWFVDLEGVTVGVEPTEPRLVRQLRRLNRRVTVPPRVRLRFLVEFARRLGPAMSARRLAAGIMAGEREWHVRYFGGRRWCVRLPRATELARHVMNAPDRYRPAGAAVREEWICDIVGNPGPGRRPLRLGQARLSVAEARANPSVVAFTLPWLGGRGRRRLILEEVAGVPAQAAPTPGAEGVQRSCR
ncbi:MAG TPA: lipopolysaccharide kinase InaA family protein [Methylomirabilota bacterium]|nr:lipopolysaccharide kinase InaA family protein [Methylomirabilota bacterium]